MVKKELVIRTLQSENGKVFILEQNIKGLNEYERAKAINRFINKETNVLETAIENYLRQIIRNNGISIQDGSQKSLESAYNKLRNSGKTIKINDRYYELGNERIIGENNGMTVILEDDILGCAIEVGETDYEN